jgi:putative ABC transport system substrate-binding protein
MSICLRRREFIAGLGGAGIALPFVVRAQQPARPVIGFLGSDGPLGNSGMVPFRQGLKEADYVEGQNVEIDFRFHREGGCNGNPPPGGMVSVACGQLRSLAEDLVRRRVAVIVTVRGIGPSLAIIAPCSGPSRCGLQTPAQVAPLSRRPALTALALGAPRVRSCRREGQL